MGSFTGADRLTSSVDAKPLHVTCREQTPPPIPLPPDVATSHAVERESRALSARMRERRDIIAGDVISATQAHSTRTTDE